MPEQVSINLLLIGVLCKKIEHRKHFVQYKHDMFGAKKTCWSNYTGDGGTFIWLKMPLIRSHFNSIDVKHTLLLLLPKSLYGSSKSVVRELVY